jgi:hypothetical protein
MKELTDGELIDLANNQIKINFKMEENYCKL